MKTKLKLLGTITLLILIVRIVTAQDCEALTREVDKFNGAITIMTPYNGQISFMKYIAKGVTSYYISLRTFGPTLELRGKGAILLFEGGQKLHKPSAKIDVAATEYGNWEYTSLIKLTPADLLLLKTKKITDYRLYIYDGEFEEIEQDRAIGYVKCILVAK